MRSSNTPPPIWLLIGLVLCLSVWVQAQTDPNGSSVGDHVAIPQSRTFAYTTGQQGAIQITSVELDVDIQDGIAQTTLTVGIVNQSAQRQEAELLYPVPEQAIISQFAYDGSGEMITAAVMGREEGKQLYQQLVSRIKDPALVEFVGHALIRTSIFPVQPHQRLTMRLTYEHVLAGDGQRYDYTLPRTESLEFQIPWKIRVQVRAGQPISAVYSPSHLIYTNRLSDNHVTAITDTEAEFTPGPFQLSYLLDTEPVNATLLAYPDENTDQSGYFLLLLGLPAERAEDDPNTMIQRELTLVLDRSGSMSGEKIKQARSAAQQVVSGLHMGEAFNVITYDSSVDFFAPAPVIKDAATWQAAHQFLGNVRDGGSTNLHEALRLALAQPVTEGMLPLILFLTDGLPTAGIRDEAAIRDLVISANPQNRRVYTFGVGYDLNAPLLDAIAEFSHAKSLFVLPGGNVEEAVTDVFHNLAGPMFADIDLEILTPGGADPLGRIQDVLPHLLPDLYTGERLVLLGRYRGTEALTFHFAGNYLGQEQAFSFTLDFAKASKHYGFIPRLWASRKIAALIGEIQKLGADPALQADDPLVEEIAQSIVNLSMQYGILTEYTVFLAQENTVLGNQVENTRRVANELVNAVRQRSGSGAVSQALNNSAQRTQDILNRDSSYLNSAMARERIVNVQQANDLTLYYKNKQWVDSRLVGLPEPLVVDRTVVYAEDEFFALADQLTALDRQGALAFAQDVVLLVDQEVVHIVIPDDVKEDYEGIDPRETVGTGGSGGSGASGRRGR